MINLNKKRSLRIFGVITLVVTLFFGLAFYAGIFRVLDRLVDADAIWLLLVLGAQAFSYWAYVIPYKCVFNLDIRSAVEHSFAGFYPLYVKSGLAYDRKTLCYKREKISPYYLSLWEYVVLAPLVLVAAIYGSIFGKLPPLLSFPWIIGVPLGSIFFGLAFVLQKRLTRFPRVQKAVDFILGMLKHQNFKNVIILLAGMTAYWLGELVSLWGALQLFNIKLSWFALLIAYATGYVVSRRNLPLGGAGIVLISLAFALHWVGLALPVALLVALAYQVCNLIMPQIVYHSRFIIYR